MIDTIDYFVFNILSFNFWLVLIISFIIPWVIYKILLEKQNVRITFQSALFESSLAIIVTSLIALVFSAILVYILLALNLSQYLIFYVRSISFIIIFIFFYYKFMLSTTSNFIDNEEDKIKLVKIYLFISIFVFLLPNILMIF